MTRFDADTPAERRKLFAEAVTAHRTRGSPFLTVEVATDPDLDGTDDDGDPLPAPWIQFAEQTFNLDVTDDERDRLEALLDDFREFRIDEVGPTCGSPPGRTPTASRGSSTVPSRTCTDATRGTVPGSSRSDRLASLPPSRCPGPSDPNRVTVGHTVARRGTT
jgi:hypothetical protein